MNIEKYVIRIQRWFRKYLVQNRLRKIVKMTDSIMNETKFQIFMKDTRISQLIYNIFSRMSLFHCHKIDNTNAPRFLLSLILFHKYHENYLSGVIGMEMYMIVEHTMNALIDVMKHPNIVSIAYFIEHFNNYVLFFEIWKQHDMKLFVEQVAHFIYELNQQKGENKEFDIKIENDILKRKQQIMALTDDPKILEYIDNYKPFDKQLEIDIQEAFDKAFMDKIHNDISKNPPDYSFIIENVKSFHDRILQLTPQNSKQQEQMKGIIELEYLEHLLNNNAFDPESFYEYAQKFKSIFEQYHAPVDIQTCTSEFQKFFDTMLSIQTMDHIQYSKLLLTFFQLCDSQISLIENRIETFYTSIKES
jgi:hypothetical protein